MTSDSPSPLDRAVLLVVDLQQPFLATVPGADALVRRTALAIAAASGLGLPVVFTEQVPAKLGRAKRQFRLNSYQNRRD